MYCGLQVMGSPVEIVYLVVLENKWKPYSRKNQKILPESRCLHVFKHQSLQLPWSQCLWVASVSSTQWWQFNWEGPCALQSPSVQLLPCCFFVLSLWLLFGLNLQPLLSQKKCWLGSWCVSVLNNLGIFPLHLGSLFKLFFILPFSRRQLKDVSYRSQEVNTAYSCEKLFTQINIFLPRCFPFSLFSLSLSLPPFLSEDSS